MNLLDIIQLVYEIPSYCCYLLFTIQLSCKLIKKDPIFSNPFYIVIFYKALNDLTLQTTIFSFSKFSRIQFFTPFYQRNSHICSIFYLITTYCYTITFEIMLIMSLNRYIAIGQPLLYTSLFQNYLVCLYLFISTVIGGSIGIISSRFDCNYIYSSELNRLYVSYTTDDITSFILTYTFALYIPLIFFSFILNITTIRKLKVTNLVSRLSTTPDVRLLIYTLFSFVIAIFFLTIYILRVISIFTDNQFYNIIGTTSLPYIVDIETYGSFYFSLFTNPHLLNMFCFQKIDETPEIKFPISIKRVYIDGGRQTSVKNS